MRKLVILLMSPVAVMTVVGSAQAQAYVPLVNPGVAISPGYAAPSYTPPVAAPGITRGTPPGYTWRQQRATEDWRNNTWREQRIDQDVRTNSWRQDRAMEDWRERQKIEKQQMPNNASETGYLAGCPAGASCQNGERTTTNPSAPYPNAPRPARAGTGYQQIGE
jgi:hypothetical protein